MTLTQRLAAARKAYVRHPSRALLRRYLILKARKGIYDPRMWDYYRVPHLSNFRLQRALVRAYATGLVATATTNGVHSPTSYHSSRHAVDFGLIETQIGTEYGLNKLSSFQKQEYTDFRQHGMVEVLGPVNGWCVLRGNRVVLREGDALENQHDNHVHEAVAS
jgi:hypothetical protein